MNKSKGKKEKPVKKSRHNWELAQESCFNCGAYSEYCTKHDTCEERYFDANGKKHY